MSETNTPTGGYAEIHNRDLSLSSSPIPFSLSPDPSALPPVRTSSRSIIPSRRSSKRSFKRMRSHQIHTSNLLLPIVLNDEEESDDKHDDDDMEEETRLTPPTRNCSNSSAAAAASASASAFAAASSSGQNEMCASAASAVTEDDSTDEHPSKRLKSTEATIAMPSYDMKDMQISAPLLACIPTALQMSVRACAATCTGYLRKINQDAYICDTLLFNESTLAEHGARKAIMIGVADGHGVLGHVAASLCKREIPALLQKYLTIESLSVQDAIRRAIADAHLHICEDAAKIGAVATCIAVKAATDTSISFVNHSLCGADYGTTIALCVMTRKTLYIANVGDSRCMVMRRSNASSSSTAELQTVFITEEHNCATDNERDRVQNEGGALEPSGSEFRIYPVTMSYREAQSRGLSMNLSRALGHIVLNKYGISSEPTLHTIELDDNCEYIVLTGSDGLFVKFTQTTIHTQFVTAIMRDVSSPLRPLFVSPVFFALSSSFQDILPPSTLQAACCNFKENQIGTFVSELLKRADTAWQEKTRTLKKYFGDNITAAIAHVITK